MNVIEEAQKERDAFLQSRRELGTAESVAKEKSTTYRSPFTLEEILALPDVEEEWVVASIVLQNAITTVSGLPNHFKSLFVQMLVKAVASGELFLGKFKADKGSVLIIDREIPTIRLKKRWKAIGAEAGVNIFFYPYSDTFKLDDVHDMKRLEALIDEHKYKLIVIDTFNRSHKGKETNSYSEIAGVFEPLKRLLEKTSIILIHHSNKSGYKTDTPTPEELMGSTDFAAETDTLFTIRKKDKDTLQVHNLKAKDSPLIDPFSLRLITKEDGSLDLQYEGEIEAPMTAPQAREKEIVDFLKSGKKKKSEIILFMKERDEKEGTINNALTVMRSKGLIDSKTEGREAAYFLLETKRTEPEQRFLLPESVGNRKQGNVIIEPCYTCRSTKFWRRHDGGTLCSACHPPVSEEDVKEWILI